MVISSRHFGTTYRSHFRIKDYAASSGNLLPTFRNNLSFQSYGFKITRRVEVIHYRRFGTTYRPIFWIQNYAPSSGNLLPAFRDDLSVPSSEFKITQRIVVITDVSAQPISPILRIQDSATMKMGPIGCPETSVRNYHYSLRNNPEERISQFYHMLESGTDTERAAYGQGLEQETPPRYTAHSASSLRNL